MKQATFLIIKLIVVITIIFFVIWGIYLSNNKQEADEEAINEIGKSVAKEDEATTDIVETIHIEKAPMIHNGTFAFSWTTEKVLGARTSDYLIPQISEIFEAVGIETINQYIIEDDTAKYATVRTMLRCYNIIDKNKGDGIAVLCHVKENKETVDVSVQIVNLNIIVFPSGHDGKTDFGFADFDGDGKDEVYTTSLDVGADNFHITIGIFPFDDGIWGSPLLWTTCGGDDSWINKGIVTYDFGFTVEGKKESFIIKNKLTNYSKNLPSDQYHEYDDSSLNLALITSVTVVDVDTDGVFELIIEQNPFHWKGKCVSLLKYNVTKKSFETVYAEFVLFDESEDDNFEEFLQKAGYDAKKAIFELKGWRM